ncbi:hypothetical protein VTO42DRAFT_4487 [Malbranchea cinnamomea]
MGPSMQVGRVWGDGERMRKSTIKPSCTIERRSKGPMTDLGCWGIDGRSDVCVRCLHVPSSLPFPPCLYQFLVRPLCRGCQYPIINVNARKIRKGQGATDFTDVGSGPSSRVGTQFIRQAPSCNTQVTWLQPCEGCMSSAPRILLSASQVVDLPKLDPSSRDYLMQHRRLASGDD